MFPGERFVHRMCIKKGSGQHLLSTPFCGPFLHPFVWYHKQKEKPNDFLFWEAQGNRMVDSRNVPRLFERNPI